MSLQAFLEWFTQGSIVLLAILMVLQWARWRDRVSLDIFLVFGSLAILLILERSLRLTHVEVAVDPSAGHQRAAGASVPPHARGVALPAGVANHPARGHRRTCCVAACHLGGDLAAALAGLVVFAFLYFIWLLGYVAWAFRQGARAAGGVTHWRMQHAALGALLLAVVFILAVLMAVWPFSRCRRGIAGSPGRARRRAELLLRLRAAGMASSYVAVLRALRVAGRSSCRGRRGVTDRRAEPAVHVRRFGSRRDRWLGGVMGRQPAGVDH